MADVFLAIAPGPVGLNKLVVIKRLRDNRQDGEFAEMFLNEAQIAARLNHPNVIHLYEVAQDESQIYLVMEYLDGQPLQRVRSRLGTEGQGLATHLRILCDALMGLHYAHELGDYDGSSLGIVHRDMSPHNVFVTHEGTTKILDFGIAKALNQTVHTRIGGVKGKIQFMSPEQARGGTHTIVDRRSDVFTVGILLWEAATGRRLWQGVEEAVIFQRLLRGDPIEAPSTVNPLVHPRLEQICMRALNTDLALRYPTAEALRLDVEAHMEDTGNRANTLDVGRFLSETFATERDSIRATIESGLKTAPVSTRLSSPTLVGCNFESSSSSVRFPHPSSLTAATLPTLVQRHPTFHAARLIAVGAASTLGVAMLVWWLLGKTKDAPPAAAIIAAQVTSVAPKDAPLATVALSIEVKPSTARLSLDDRVIGTGSFRGQLPRASGVHVLRADADGYQPAQVEVSLERDSDVQLSLSSDPTSEEATKRARSAKYVNQPAPNPLRVTSKKKPPKVIIDTENPW